METHRSTEGTGGLGFRDLSDHANTLVGRWILYFLDDPSSKWAIMFEVNLKLLKWKDERIHRRNHYTLTDKILFGEVVSFGSCHYMEGIWKAWVELRKATSIRQHNCVILGRWRVTNLIYFVMSL